MRRKSSMANI